MSPLVGSVCVYMHSATLFSNGTTPVLRGSSEFLSPPPPHSTPTIFPFNSLTLWRRAHFNLKADICGSKASSKRVELILYHGGDGERDPGRGGWSGRNSAPTWMEPGLYISKGHLRCGSETRHEVPACLSHTPTHPHPTVA